MAIGETRDTNLFEFYEQSFAFVPPYMCNSWSGRSNSICGCWLPSASLYFALPSAQTRCICKSHVCRRQTVCFFKFLFDQKKRPKSPRWDLCQPAPADKKKMHNTPVICITRLLDRRSFLRSDGHRSWFTQRLSTGIGLGCSSRQQVETFTMDTSFAYASRRYASLGGSIVFNWEKCFFTPAFAFIHFSRILKIEIFTFLKKWNFTNFNSVQRPVRDLLHKYLTRVLLRPRKTQIFDFSIKSVHLKFLSIF